MDDAAQTSGTGKKGEEGVVLEGPLAELYQRSRKVVEAASRSTFFHIVALLERLTPDAKEVGRDGPVRDERIRFRHDADLSFSAGDISSLRIKEMPRSAEASLSEPIPVFEVQTTFLGLTGTMSPLPLYIAEEVLHEDDENPIRRDFLDIFHHRIISLLYRAVSKYRPARTHVTTRSDPWMKRALYLTNLDPAISGRGVRVHPSVLVRLAPLLAGRGRGPRQLALCLREALGEALDPDGRVEVKQFAGGWVEVDAEQRMRLGEANANLGREAILGSRAYDQSGRFAVEIGPLHRHNYQRFMREGDLLPVVKDVVELCVREPLDFDVHLLLAPDAAPSFLLSTERGAVLGRDSRLRGGDPTVAEVMTVRGVSNIDFDAPADASAGASAASASA
jgi:type VI secretion system protein ImpH